MTRPRRHRLRPVPALAVGIFATLVVTPLLAPPARADSAEADTSSGGTFNAQLENDFFGNTDRHFTHGTKLSYVTAESAPLENDPIAVAARYVPFFPENSRARASYTLGQSIFTPEDISRRDLIRSDRPYAGWLYAGFGLVVEDAERRRIDNLELDIGVVGPWAHAETAQRTWHRWFDFRDPKGWDNQIDNEPGVLLLYERQQRAAAFEIPGELEADVIPGFGFAAGNVATYASGSLTVRLGADLSVDYGPPRVRPSLPTGGFLRRHEGFNWYVFAGVGGRVVARNIFLDGNSFADSHSVDKKTFVGDLQAGLALQWKDWRLTYTHILRTKEYDLQNRPDRFGALSLSRRF